MITYRQTLWRLTIILLIYASLSMTYSILLPLHKAPDEMAHFQYSHFIAETGHLPRSARERESAGDKSAWPPVYHMLVAIVTSGIESGNPPYLKIVRDLPKPDLPSTLLSTREMVNTEDENFPYRGQILRWHLGRLVSLVLSLGTIIVAFLTALEIFPGNFRLALTSAAILGFMPTFIFISSSMSDDTLVGLVIGLFFLVLVKIIKRPAITRYYVWLGLLMGIAVTVKYSTIILPLEVVLVVAYLAWQHRLGWSAWLKRIALVAAMAIIVSAWWFTFLLLNFNEIDDYGLVVGSLKSILVGGVDASQDHVASLLTGGQVGQGIQADSSPFWAWAVQMYQSLWVMKLGEYPLAPLAHLLIGVVCLVTVIGLILGWRRRRSERIWIALLILHVSIFLVFPLIRFSLQGKIAETAQGRHVLFPAATVLPLLIVYGWQVWLSSKAQRRLALAVVGGLVCWSLAQLVYVVACCPFRIPVRTTPDVVAQIPHRLDQPFGNHVVLLGYDSQIVPAIGTLKMSLYWQSPSYAEEDYRIEVDLIQDGTSELRWVAYPTNGRYPTRIWENWETIRDEFEFPLANLSPGAYQIQLKLLGSQGPLTVNGTDTLMLPEITVPQVATIEPELVSPIVVGDREVVTGLKLWHTDAYRKLDRFEYRPRMAIPFVWQGQPETDEKVKWLLVNELGQIYPAQQAAAYFEYFLVGPDWPSGDYRLRAEVWHNDEVAASAEIDPRITVLNKQPRLMELPSIPNPLQANFADRVKLLGYHLPRRSLEAGDGVPITLYWQGLRTMERDFTFYTKLLDDHKELRSSVERYAQDGYKTTHWFENEIVVDQFELPTPENAPPGVYWLNVGLYVSLDQSIVSLPLVNDGQLTDVTSVTFGPIKIGGAPPGVVANEVAASHTLNMDLNGVIRLSGYDLSQLDKALLVRLYWESLQPTDVDYTVFIHLQNQSGETVAQMDRPPIAGAYPTSLWESGELIPDELLVPIPENLPPGQYNIVVGLYDYETGARLPVNGSTENSILLSTVKM